VEEEGGSQTFFGTGERKICNFFLDTVGVAGVSVVVGTSECTLSINESIKKEGKQGKGLTLVNK
jgi:hypothetical protein